MTIFVSMGGAGEAGKIHEEAQYVWGPDLANHAKLG